MQRQNSIAPKTPLEKLRDTYMEYWRQISSAPNTMRDTRLNKWLERMTKADIEWYLQIVVPNSRKNIGVKKIEDLTNIEDGLPEEKKFATFDKSYRLKKNAWDGQNASIRPAVPIMVASAGAAVGSAAVENGSGGAWQTVERRKARSPTPPKAVDAVVSVPVSRSNVSNGPSALDQALEVANERQAAKKAAADKKAAELAEEAAKKAAADKKAAELAEEAAKKAAADEKAAELAEEAAKKAAKKAAAERAAADKKAAELAEEAAKKAAAERAAADEKAAAEKAAADEKAAEVKKEAERLRQVLLTYMGNVDDFYKQMYKSDVSAEEEIQTIRYIMAHTNIDFEIKKLRNRTHYLYEFEFERFRMDMHLEQKKQLLADISKHIEYDNLFREVDVIMGMWIFQDYDSRWSLQDKSKYFQQYLTRIQSEIRNLPDEYASKYSGTENLSDAAWFLRNARKKIQENLEKEKGKKAFDPIMTDNDYLDEGYVQDEDGNWHAPSSPRDPRLDGNAGGDGGAASDGNAGSPALSRTNSKSLSGGAGGDAEDFPRQTNRSRSASPEPVPSHEREQDSDEEDSDLDKPLVSGSNANNRKRRKSGPRFSNSKKPRTSLTPEEQELAKERARKAAETRKKNAEAAKKKDTDEVTLRSMLQAIVPLDGSRKPLTGRVTRSQSRANSGCTSRGEPVQSILKKDGHAGGSNKRKKAVFDPKVLQVVIPARECDSDDEESQRPSKKHMPETHPSKPSKRGGGRDKKAK